MLSAKNIIWKTVLHLIILGLIWGPLYTISYVIIPRLKTFTMDEAGSTAMGITLYYFFFHIVIAIAFVFLYNICCQFLRIENVIILKCEMAIFIGALLCYIVLYSDFTSKVRSGPYIMMLNFCILGLIYSLLESRSRIAVSIRQILIS